MVSFTSGNPLPHQKSLFPSLKTLVKQTQTKITFGELWQGIVKPLLSHRLTRSERGGFGEVFRKNQKKILEVWGKNQERNFGENFEEESREKIWGRF